MTDLERVIKAVNKTRKRLEKVVNGKYVNPAAQGAYLAMKILLQELRAVAKAEEKSDG